MNKQKRLPLEYPEGLTQYQQAEVRKLHQSYLEAVMTVEQTTAEMMEIAAGRYLDALSKIGQEDVA